MKIFLINLIKIQEFEFRDSINKKLFKTNKKIKIKTDDLLFCRYLLLCKHLIFYKYSFYRRYKTSKPI